MAKPPCSNQDGNEAYLSLVNLDNGEVATPCILCLPAFALSMAAGLTTGLGPEEADALGALFDQIAANDTRTKTATAAARRAGRRKPASGLTADPPDDQADHDAPPPAPAAAVVALAGPENAAAMLVALDPPCSECGGITGTGDSVKLTCNDCGAVIATVDELGTTGPQ